MLRRRMARRAGGGRARRRWSTRRRCWRCRPRWRTSRSRTRSAATSSRSTAATREHPPVLVGASPRGSLALLLLARARAAMAGRDYVVPEDVKEVAVPALAHRITLRPEMWLRRVDPVVRGRRGAGSRARAGQRRAARPTRRHGAPSRGWSSPTAEWPLRPRRAVRPAGAEQATAARLGADPGARPGRAAHRLLLVARRRARAGSTWWCWPRRSRSAPRARCAAARAALPGLRLSTDGDAPASRAASWPPRCRSATPTRSATTWSSCGCTISPWLRAGRRPTGRTRSPCRPAGWPRPGAGRRALRWGRHALGPAAARAVACDGLLASRPVVTRRARRAGLSGDRAVRRPTRRCRGRPVWSASTGRGGRARAASWPACGSSRPATGCAASTGGSRCAPSDCMSPRRCPTATPRWCCCSTCSPRPGRSGGVQRHRLGARHAPCGPAPRSPSTTCTAATGSRCWSTARRARRLRPASGRRQYLTVLEWLLDVRAERPGTSRTSACFGSHRHLVATRSWSC